VDALQFQKLLDDNTKLKQTMPTGVMPVGLLQTL
jgi:hypothetical protein